MSITAQGFSARGLILLSSWLRDNGNLFTPKIACVGGVGGACGRVSGSGGFINLVCCVRPQRVKGSVHLRESDC